jgi:hypothetical protein
MWGMTMPLLILKRLDGSVIAEASINAVLDSWAWVVDAITDAFPNAVDIAEIETDDGDIITVDGVHVARVVKVMRDIRGVVHRFNDHSAP